MTWLAAAMVTEWTSLLVVAKGLGLFMSSMGVIFLLSWEIEPFNFNAKEALLRELFEYIIDGFSSIITRTVLIPCVLSTATASHVIS